MCHRLYIRGVEDIMDLKQVPIERLVTVVNKELDSGLSVNKSCDKLGIKKTTLRDYMGRNGYEYNKEKHRYSKIEEKFTERNIKEAKTDNQVNDDNVIQNVTTSDNQLGTMSDNVLMIPIASDDIEILKEMIDHFKRHKSINNVPVGTIVVEMPQEENGDFRKTLRLNKTIYLQFEKFCNENKQFTIKELVSQALKEFLEKYNRE